MKKSKWTRAQIELLLEKTKSGNVRMHAFEEVARQTRRKANSVRNYYYKNLAQDKTKIIPFPPAEVRQLLREIVLGTSRGESVRSICMRLSGGDKPKMLRYQNKYRTVLRTQPHRIEDVKKTLEGQGYLVKSPVASRAAPHIRTDLQNNTVSGTASADNIITLPVNHDRKLTDTDVNNLFMGLMRLVKKQAADSIENSFKNQIAALKAEIERLKINTAQGVK